MQNCTLVDETAQHAASSDDLVGFLGDVLPVRGVYFVAARRVGGLGFEHFACSTVAEVALKALEIDAQSRDVYFACSSYEQERYLGSDGKTHQRTAENAAYAKSFWLDIDCGEDKAAAEKGYASKQQALTALTRFCLGYRIPAPSIVVDSGGGIHCYWTFTTGVEKEQWLQAARAFKQLCKQGPVPLLADPARTGDIAGILRPPGTHNWKPERGGPAITIKARGRQVEFALFDSRIKAAASELGIAVSTPTIDPNDDLIGAPTPLPLEELQDALRYIDPDTTRPRWWSVLAAAADEHGEDARGLLRDWSAGALHGRTAASFDETDFEHQYTNCLSREGREGARCTMGSVIMLAREGGWKRLALPEPPAVPSTTTVVVDGEPGDILAGRIFAATCRDKLLYVNQVGRWLAWDTARWIWCAKGEEMAAAKHVAGGVLEHAAKLYAQDPEKHKRRLAFAMRLQNLQRLEAMLTLARSERGMTVGHMSELDPDPWLLGVRNGVVDLRTGALLRADPGMRITRQMAAEYHPDAQCPRWLKFLHEIHDGDVDTIAFRQRAYGYTLTGVVTEEVMFIDFGSGANGKSVCANVVSTLFADYGQTAPPSLLTLRRDGDAAPRNDIARLCGTRLAQINELAQGDRLDEQVVKLLAGRENLTARFLHREFFDFAPTAKSWLRTNHRPVITGDDDGIWRRILLTPFRRKFSEGERDPWLEGALLDERDGILAWMVEGCLAWKRAGLAPSPTVRTESSTYRTESDLLGQFLDDNTQAGTGRRVPQGTLYFEWEQWCGVNGTYKGTKASFTRRLGERGFSPTKSNGVRYYGGLELHKQPPLKPTQGG